MRHSNRIGYALLLVIGMGLLLSYQNCSDPKLVKVKASNVPKCLDENKNLTIVSSVNTTASSLSEGRSDFQVFEVKDGVLKAFVPESPDSNIVPEWTKNDNPPQLPPLGDDELKSFNGIAGVIYNTNLEYNDCRAEEIKAKMQICGNDLVLNKSFMVGNCLPIQCEEHGVVAEFGELGEFFKAGDCDGGCQSIKRLCQANGEFGPPVDENGNPIEANVDEYQEASCRVDTPVGGCPIDPEDGGPGPQENLVCPQI
ncbi:MAG: hypothetical protein KDD37_09805, partial [Bdellovibrionales bacterium]|nr:hypothetical protein [Bdellovibrionales bacterium]